MSFYISPYRYFSLHRHYYRGILPILFFYILPRLQCFPIYTIETLIIGVFLYIEETLFFLLYFAPAFFIYSVFPIVKITLFCLYISFFFCILPRLQCMFFLYIYMEIRHFALEKYVFYYIYRRKTLFSYYIFSICVFSLYTQEYLSYI